jgi:hypothetical protein
MRLTAEELLGITGKEIPSAQVRWFKLHYGVNLTHDRRGVVLTKAAFDGLVAKQCGLGVENKEEIRPQVKLRLLRHQKT